MPGAPDLALRSERAANATAARLLGFSETDGIENILRDGDALLIVGDDLHGVGAADLDGAASIVYLGTALPAAVEARVAVVPPITNVLEEEGTMTNLRGRVQRFLQAKAAPGVARPTWYVLADLLTEVGGNGRFYLPAEVFAALAFLGFHERLRLDLRVPRRVGKEQINGLGRQIIQNVHNILIDCFVYDDIKRCQLV